MCVSLPAGITNNVIYLKIVSIIVDVCLFEINLQQNYSAIGIVIPAVSIETSLIFLSDRDSVLSIGFNYKSHEGKRVSFV